MFSYLDDDYNVFSDAGSSANLPFDDISSFNATTFPLYVKFSEDLQAGPENAFSPFDTSSESCSSHSISTPEASDDNDSMYEKSNDMLAPYFEDDDRPMLAGLARRRSWKSFRRTLPANLPLAPMDRISEQQQDLPIGLRSSAMRRSQILTLPLLTQPSPLRRRPSTSSIFSGSDQDADGESDNAGTDDEYVPSPEPTSNKRRRSYSSARRTEVPDRPASSFRDSVYLPHTTTKRLRVSPPSRNKQASAATSAAIVRVVNNNLVEKTNFICPECGWRQLNRRIPDFKRHLKTHLRAKDDDHNEGFWCKGVPVEDARKYLIRSGAEPYKFLDHHRVGGCMRTFSRRDALKRHLDNANIACISECMD